MKYSLFTFAALAVWGTNVSAQNTLVDEAKAPTTTLVARGRVATGWPQISGVHSTGAPSLADLDGDGRLEVVMKRAKKGDAPNMPTVLELRSELAAWNFSGEMVKGWPVELHTKPTLGWAPASVADLDEDGRDEVIVPFFTRDAGPNPEDKGIRMTQIFRGTGEKWPFELEAPFDPHGGGLPVIDINLDGIDDLVAGQVLTSVEGEAPGRMTGWTPDKMPRGYAPCIGDANGDGKPETYQPDYEKHWHRWPDQPEAHTLSGFDNSGDALPGWPQRITHIVFNPVLGDVWGDTKKEVCVADGTMIHLWTWDGKRLPSTVEVGEFSSVFKRDNRTYERKHRDNTYTAVHSFFGASLADLDGDAKAEILAFNTDRFLYAWHGDGRGMSSPSGRLLPIPDGVQMDEAVVADLGADGEMDIVVGSLWFTLKKDGSIVQTNLAQGHRSSASLGDLNADGKAEIVFADEKLQVVVYETELAWRPETAQWPTARGNFRRTGAWQAPKAKP